MSVSGGIGKMKQARQILQAQWDETSSAWQDENSRRFEERVIAPLLTRVRQVEQALGQMDVILHEVRRDCG